MLDTETLLIIDAHSADYTEVERYGHILRGRLIATLTL